MSGRSPRWIKEIQKTPTTCLVEYSGTFTSSRAYVIINGTTYTSEGSQTVDAGTVISIYVSGTSSYRDNCYVTLDGKRVKSGYGTYEYTVLKNSKLVFTKGTNTYYYCNITTS